MQSIPAAVADRGLRHYYRLTAAGYRVLHPDRNQAVSAARHALRDRPAGSALDAAVRAGDHVCIAMLDRAFRSQRDTVGTLEAWLARGVTVHLLDIGADTATPVGQLTVGILAVVAQWESRRIGERIREAKAARGVRPTAAPASAIGCCVAAVSVRTPVSGGFTGRSPGCAGKAGRCAKSPNISIARRVCGPAPAAGTVKRSRVLSTLVGQATSDGCRRFASSRGGKPRSARPTQ